MYSNIIILIYDFFVSVVSSILMIVNHIIIIQGIWYAMSEY